MDQRNPLDFDYEHYYECYTMMYERESICNHKEVKAIVRSSQVRDIDGEIDTKAVVRQMAERVGRPSSKVEANHIPTLEELPQ